MAVGTPRSGQTGVAGARGPWSPLIPYGFARVSFLGSETVTRIVFGPEDAEPLLGVVALESTGIGVDPVTKTLRRMAAKPLK